MKLLATGAALAAFLGGSAMAADLPVYAPRPAIVTPLYNWTGCYIGANIGDGWSSTSFKDATTLASLGTNNSASGVFGGGQVGCDYQLGWAVFGIQGMFDGVSAHSENIWPLPEAVNTTRLRRFSTVTGRLGVTPTPTFLVYLRAGAAWVGDDHAVQTPSGALLFTANTTRSGWTAGMGLEWGFASNWSFFVEYDYADFATKTLAFTPAPVAEGIVFPIDIPVGHVFPINIRQTVNLMQVGINYRFGFDWLRY
jgi:outer membrane immunogenic protein